MEPKSRFKSKTNIFAALLAALGVAQTQIPTLAIPPEYQGFVLMGLAVTIAFLRELTDQPVG